tara:strand:+ start:282 stop:398 length:117 start_codon:yes stop_codon:yes gene_type:complete
MRLAASASHNLKKMRFMKDIKDLPRVDINISAINIQYL